MDFLGYALVAAVLWFVVSKIYEGYRQEPKHCLTCGNEATAETKTPGSLMIEVVLWLCFIVPGLIYSIWRMSSRTDVCAVCGSNQIIPTDSPAAVAHRKALGQSH